MLCGLSRILTVEAVRFQFVSRPSMCVLTCNVANIHSSINLENFTYVCVVFMAGNDPRNMILKLTSSRE